MIAVAASPRRNGNLVATIAAAACRAIAKELTPGAKATLGDRFQDPALTAGPASSGGNWARGTAHG